jgi:HAMP domain-containing protein
MVTQSTDTKSKGSVTRRFNLALALLYLVCIVVSAPGIYLYTRSQVFDQAKTELNMLVDMVESIKGYVGNDLRPYFIDKGLFHTPGFSGIVAIARVAEHFKDRQPSYTIRSVSDNPLNKANLPERTEQGFLDRFRADPELRTLTEQGLLGGRNMLLSVTSMKSRKGCLRCHGAPDKVPEQIVSQYGSDSGYNYKVGDTVGLSLIGVPLTDVNTLAMNRSLAAVGLLTLLFGAVFITVNLLVRRYLITPILKITEVAHGVAKGDLDRSLSMERNDEIGDLARSVELLRRSFSQIMKRMRKGAH